MVDFRKAISQKESKVRIDPLEIYEGLDRASDKGPLRPAQTAILQSWNKLHRNKKDLVIKLHTGQGKTLIGLLILQSKLNETNQPAVYLCPNRFLITQTCTQARQFGIPFCEAPDDLPAEFLDGKKILITTVQKLFNGLSKFGTGKKSLKIGSILFDDAHACVDAIRDAFTISIPSDDSVYHTILKLFEDELVKQGAGTFAEIGKGNIRSFLPVPYWSWKTKALDVVKALADATDRAPIKFAWPLLKDGIENCRCLISGDHLEISPYLAPLELFGTYQNAETRIFMSATITDDSFLVKGLGLSPETITTPLTYDKEKWSGEKMVLIPPLIDPSLDRPTIVNKFAKKDPTRKHGVVVLVPSFRGTEDWKQYGATVAEKKTIETEVEKFRAEKYDTTLVIVNRYDGIDLPDDICRILIVDSKPYADNLSDRYAEECRPTSDVNAIRLARTIEQGMGRSVRGEKDYCVIMIIGPELVKTIRTKESRKHLSNETNAQVGIGLSIAEMAMGEIEKGTNPLDALTDLIKQCLKRDEGWKDYYFEQMNKVKPKLLSESLVLKTYEMEFRAEKKFLNGDIDGARTSLQQLIDKYVTTEEDKGWYLQEMARFEYRRSQTTSNKLQITAHNKNRLLLLPQSGMEVQTMLVVEQQRAQNISHWIRKFEDFDELRVALEEVLNQLSFGVAADRFEDAFNRLAECLGFGGERPEKEWKAGPDNLWGLRNGHYLLVECKNEVAKNRAGINKYEANQMNTSCNWFKKSYPKATSLNLMIIPIAKLERAAAFTHNVIIMRDKELNLLKTNVRNFFEEFRNVDLKAQLSDDQIQQKINAHKLSPDNFSAYGVPAKSFRE